MGGHWIAGVEVDGAGHGRFEAPGRGAGREAWPRASAEDLAVALAAAHGPAARAWATLDERERRERVASLLVALGEGPMGLPPSAVPVAPARAPATAPGGAARREHRDRRAAAPQSADGFGAGVPRPVLATAPEPPPPAVDASKGPLGARERARLAQRAAALLEPPAFGAFAPPAPRRLADGTPDVALLLAHRTLLAADLAARAADALVAGWAVVVLADPLLPGPAEALAHAAARHVGGLVAVLHAGEDALAAVEWPAVGALLGRASSWDRAAVWRGAARAAGARWIEGQPPARGAARVGVHADPAVAARELAERAFGVASLGGQLPGAPHAVWVAPRALAPLAEALLELFDREPERLVLPPPLDPQAPQERGRRVARALDEGATLIAGDAALGRSRAPWGPAVFVNGELAPRVLAEREPLPVLLLARETEGLPRGLAESLVALHAEDGEGSRSPLGAD